MAINAENTMQTENTETESLESLRILSLDGGGIRGISSLLILENIMEMIREADNLNCVPRPCEYFDFIGGTSTGGIIAIMLGRLRMTVDECIRAYKEVARQAFTPKWTFPFFRPSSGSFSAKALESAIKKTVREYCNEEQCVSRRRNGYPTLESCSHGDIAFRNSDCIETVVLAVTKDNVDAPPTLFKTYDTSAAFSGCTIWQVARATSAATTFFKSIKVGRDNIEYIDAGFGYNNPCDVLIHEALQRFPRRSKIQVLSIGTGLGDVITIDHKWTSLIAALKKMATSSKKVAASLNDRYGDSGQYYRFNVEHGLRDITLCDWDKSSKISAHTHNYLSENQKTLKGFVDNFLKSQKIEAAQPHALSTISTNINGASFSRPQGREMEYTIEDEESDDDALENQSNFSHRGRYQCFRCRKYGHLSYNCPKQDVRCYKCGVVGHYPDTCNRRQGYCYNCKLWGHFANTCYR